jgi:hypothetical protein
MNKGRTVNEMKILEAVKAKPGTWIGVVELAGQTGLDRQELAEAFEALMDDPKFQAEPNPFGWRITPADREMAPVIGDEARHLIRWN